MGDSQPIGKIFVNRPDKILTQKMFQILARKGFRPDQKLLKKILARRLAMYSIKRKTNA